MISNPRLLSYTCIAKGTIVLADYISNGDIGIEDVALRCIENTPPHHSFLSHTIHKKTYTFAINDSFTYFAIFDESVEKLESFSLLNRLKSAIEDMVREGEIDPSPRCLQSKFDPIFEEIVGVGLDLELDMDLVGSPRSVARESRNPSIDSSKGRKVALMPLLGKALKNKKKKRSKEEDSDTTMKEISEKKVDLCGNGNDGVLRKEHHQSQKVKEIWKKHVLMVLLFDFCICVVLFGIWLWICQGFQCING